MCAAGNRLMIRDTSATDRPVEVKPKRKQQLILLGMGVLVVVLLVIFAPPVLGIGFGQQLALVLCHGRARAVRA